MEEMKEAGKHGLKNAAKNAKKPHPKVILLVGPARVVYSS